MCDNTKTSGNNVTSDTYDDNQMTQSRRYPTGLSWTYIRSNIERILVTFQDLLQRLWQHGWQRVAWIREEFGAIILCFLCVYGGVISTTWLSPLLLAHTYFPELANFTVSPLGAIAITILVCAGRAYPRWQAAHKRSLGLRMLHACCDGVTWPLWWRRTR
jgi:hypothetical protein